MANQDDNASFVVFPPLPSTWPSVATVVTWLILAHMATIMLLRCLLSIRYGECLEHINLDVLVVRLSVSNVSKITIAHSIFCRWGVSIENGWRCPNCRPWLEISHCKAKVL